MNRIMTAAITTFVLCPALWAADIQPRQFAEKAAISDMFELEAAKIELKNGKSDKIRAFADMMAKDHAGSTQNLKDAAAKENVALPSRLDAAHQEKLDAIKPLTGVALDAAYASTQISAHTDAVALLEAYAKDGQSGPLKGFAEQTLPTVRMHLIRIKGLNSGE